MIAGLVDTISTEMTAKLEAEIRRALDHVEPGWSLHDIVKRCELVSYRSRPEQYLCLDGKPLLEIWPTESSIEHLEDRHVLRYTRQFRRLYVK